MTVLRALIATAVFLVSIAAGRAEACSCSHGPGPACQAAFAADTVFAGEARRVARTATGLRVDFEVRERFRGELSPTVVVLTGTGGGDCGFPFVAGESYVVYGTRVPGTDELRAFGTGCSRTRSVADAAEDRAFLRTLDDPAPAGARAFGHVKHVEPNVGRAGVTTYPPLAGLAIVLRDGARTFNARTDSEGRYEFSLAPVGPPVR